MRIGAGIRTHPSSPVGLAVAGIATLILAIGAVVAGWDNVRYLGAPTVPGVVVAHEQAPIGDDEGWKIVVEWQDEDGQQWRTPSKVASSHPREIGTEVPVQYLPNGEVRIATFLERWFMTMLIGGIGLIFALVTAWGLWSRYRSRR